MLDLFDPGVYQEKIRWKEKGGEAVSFQVVFQLLQDIHLNAKSPEQYYMFGAFLYKNGDDLLSHTVTHAVPSALKSLTSVFGMGTGGASSLWSP